MKDKLDALITKQSFIDSDNLRDLRKLLDHVRDSDVLVLFQTDDTGRVIRTAVPRALGGGLDALAERIVRGMTFEPARVDGIATGLRSQVMVRFAAAD